MNIPKKRPALNIDSSTSYSRRKPSTTSITSAHPLRQTSFPPSEQVLASARGPSFSPAVKAESVVSSAGPSTITKLSNAGRKGKSKKAKRDSSRGVTAGASTVANDRGDSAQPEKEEDEPDEDDEGAGGNDTVLEGRLHMTEAEKRKEAENLAQLLDRFSDDQMQRYEAWKRAALRKDTVRRLVNQTLSQSVPASIIIAVRAYVKVFIGEIIEEARVVQTEWIAASPALPTGQPNPVYPGITVGAPKMNGVQATVGSRVANSNSGDVKMEDVVSPSTLQATERASSTIVASVRPDIEECDRGPLTPDHLREAYRRYRRNQRGGNAGVLGVSLQGKQSVSARTGGRKRLPL